MKASFMIIPALLLSAAAQHAAKSNKAHETAAVQAPAQRVVKRGWFNWLTNRHNKDGR
jgi:hypothetical protein